MSLRNHILGQLSVLLTRPGLDQLFIRRERVLAHLRGTRPQACLYYGLTDPNAYLLLQWLLKSKLPETYDWQLVGVDEEQVFLSTERERWLGYALEDHYRQAARWGLASLAVGSALPPPNAGTANRTLHSGPVREVGPAWLAATEAAYRGEHAAPSADTRAHLRAGSHKLTQAGHYQSGMLRIGGLWLGGLDRIHIAAQLPSAEALAHSAPPSPLNPCPAGIQPLTAKPGWTLDYIMSVRSPYSYLGLQLARQLCDSWDIPLRIQVIFPMVRRGLKIPAVKKLHLLRDAARCARWEGQGFGPVCDPLGPGLEHGICFVQRVADGPEGYTHIHALMQAVWSQALDLADTTAWHSFLRARGMDPVAFEAWEKSGQWRQAVELTSQEHGELGYWGVPILVLRRPDGTVHTSSWGHDRLWVIHQALQGV